ncbi:hypothetical protein ABZ318_15560 [Streptomyces sp. NPDC006197]|uniref:hypothetical protein n=1 Tax=Streptomyces sp. NPDC006197 TaxID=3156685 RepID=UPI0033B220D6
MTDPLGLPRAKQLLAELSEKPHTITPAWSEMYRAAVKLWHPDLGGDQQVFKLLERAYQVVQAGERVSNVPGGPHGWGCG